MTYIRSPTYDFKLGGKVSKISRAQAGLLHCPLPVITVDFQVVSLNSCLEIDVKMQRESGVKMYRVS